MLTRDLARLNSLPYVIHIEADGEIIESLRDYSAGESSVIVRTARHIVGASGLHAHIRHEGRYIAELRATSREVFAEHHYYDGGANVMELYRVDPEESLIVPLQGAHCLAFD